MTNLTVIECIPGYMNSDGAMPPVFTDRSDAVSYLKEIADQWAELDWRMEGNPEDGRIDAFDDERIASHVQTAYIDELTEEDAAELMAFHEAQ